MRDISDVHTFAVCAYGESPYLEECLASLALQSVRSNIVICTSTPNESVEALAHRHEVPLMINDAEPGLASDWNFAYAMAKTPLVTITHQDDVYLPDFAERVFQFYEQADDPLILFTDYGELRDDELVLDSGLLNVKRVMLKPLENRRRADSKVVRRAILSLGSAICCPSVTYCKTRLPERLFSESFQCDLDWDCWERLSRLSGSFVYINEVLMLHRIHDESETTRLIGNHRRQDEDLEMLSRYWPRPIASLVNAFYGRGVKSNSL